jgi:hypothetical protein
VNSELIARTAGHSSTDMGQDSSPGVIDESPSLHRDCVGTIADESYSDVLKS